jgi:phage baseplate assembly protein gpV
MLRYVKRMDGALNSYRHFLGNHHVNNIEGRKVESMEVSLRQAATYFELKSNKNNLSV